MSVPDVVRAVATPQRAVEVIGGLLGDTVAFGPVPAGPGGMATARAHGRLGRPRASSAGQARIAVVVPAELDVRVQVGTQTVPVEVDLVVRVGLAASLDEPRGQVVIEVDELGPADVDVTSAARGAAGVLVRRMGDLDNEVRRHVVAWVTALLSSPEAHAARHIPVGEADSA